MIYTGQSLTWIPDYRPAKFPDIGEGRDQVGASQSSIQRPEAELEEALEEARKDVAEQEARIKDMRGIMLDPLIGT